MKSPDRIKHFNVKVLPDGRYGIGQRKFDTLYDLIAYYHKAPIFTSNEEKMFLTSGISPLS